MTECWQRRNFKKGLIKINRPFRVMWVKSISNPAKLFSCNPVTDELVNYEIFYTV